MSPTDRQCCKGKNLVSVVLPLIKLYEIVSALFRKTLKLLVKLNLCKNTRRVATFE